MDTFLEWCDLLKLTQEELENSNRHVASNEIKLATKIFFTK